MAGTTIGEVNINLRMSLAQFKQDTRDGTKAASDATKQMASEISGNSQEAKASLALIGEEIGVGIPRHIRGFIAALPGATAALSAAFSAVAVVALAEVLVKVIEKVNQLSEAMGGFGETAQAAWKQLIADNQDALKFAEDLRQKYRELALIGLSGAAKDAEQQKISLENQAAALVKVTQLLQRKQDIERELASAPTHASEPGYVKLGEAIGLNVGKVKELTEENAKLDHEMDAQRKLLSTDVFKTQKDQMEASANAASRLADAMKKLAKAQGEAWAQAVKARDALIPSKAPDVIGDAFTAERSKAPPSFNETFGKGLEKANQDVLNQAKQVYESTRTSAEKYAEELEHLNDLSQQGVIDTDTYSRAVADAKLKFDDTAKATRQFGMEIADTLKQGALWGSDWKSALESIGIEVAQLILKLTLLKNVQSGLGGATSGVGGFFSSLLSGFGGFKAAGGPLDAGKWYIAGEHGPEPVWGGGAGAFATGYGKPSGGGGNGGTVNNITMHLHGVTDADSFRKSQSQISSQMGAMLSRHMKRNG